MQTSGTDPRLIHVFRHGKARGIMHAACPHWVTDQDHDENLGPRVQKAMDQFPSYSGEMPPPEAAREVRRSFSADRNEAKLVASLDGLYMYICDVMMKGCKCDICFFYSKYFCGLSIVATCLGVSSNNF